LSNIERSTICLGRLVPNKIGTFFFAQATGFKRTFGDVPLNVELKLEVWDSPNSAGVVIDALRCAKLAMNHGIGGALLGPSAYFMKSPAIQYTDDQAHQMVEDFIAQYGGKPGATPSPTTNGHREAEPATVQELPVVE
jgi:hypothetical protein